jgi:hypothetical protein
MQTQTVIHRLTQVQNFKPSGVLVTVQGQSQVLTPATTIVTKGNQKQFWTYVGHEAVLVVYTGSGWVAQLNQNKRRQS